MRAILITGYKGSGKDTVAGIIKEKLRDKAKIVKFADPIKKSIQIMFGWNESHTDGSLKEVIDPAYGVSPRQVMQYLGTEVMQYMLGRKYPKFKDTTGRTLWVKALLELVRGSNTIIVPDCRFPHEVSGVKNAESITDTIVIRVIRGKVSWWDKLWMHSSEKSIDKIKPDYSIVNNGSMLELSTTVIELLHNVGLL